MHTETYAYISIYYVKYDIVYFLFLFKKIMSTRIYEL